jgi:hypothetical protein
MTTSTHPPATVNLRWHESESVRRELRFHEIDCSIMLSRISAEQDAYVWYEGRSPGLGDRFLGAVDETMELVREAPARFPEKYREPEFSIRRAWLMVFPTVSSSSGMRRSMPQASSPVCMRVATLAAGFSARDG